MSLPRHAVAALLVGLLQACGGSHSESAASGGSGPGSAGSGGLQAAGGAAADAGAGNAAGGGAHVIGPQTAADKLDVLFVVDNSLSMGGKQQLLANSLPRFVARLTNPLCVDDQGVVTEQPAGPTAPCSSGSREFKPITDIHFGAITTSIGGHGGDVCGEEQTTGYYDDQAQLLPSKRTGVASYQNSGFLAFDATGNAGVNDAASLASDLSAMITAAGEDGCGYEAPLEAMYRFLADPEPPLSVQVVDQKSTPTGINETLLAQRNAFLRPDSSLAVVIFSDENDCSIKDSGLGWFVASVRSPGSTGGVRMPRASSVCGTDPNDPCCRSCAENEPTPPSGCAPLTQDSVCSVIASGQPYASYDAVDDSLNLRCFEQQRRFGFDLLQPIERYTSALSDLKIKNRAGALVDNPLFAARDGKGPRSATLVSLSVIVGVPWQDLATPDSLTGGARPTYLDAAGVESNGRWPMVLGDERNNIPPSDPLMIESMAPRTGKSPLTPFALAPATSPNPQENPINGHEKNDVDHSDLQHACIFHLPKPILCEPDMYGCDCAPDRSGDPSYVIAENSALCQPPGGGLATTTQYSGKAYPSTRELTLARQLGERAAPASLCAWQTTNTDSPDYGYGPAFDSLLKRIAKTIK